MQLDLRSAMRNFATGVCLATTYLDGPQGRRHDAITVNSLTSVSLDPPLVSICLHRDSTFLTDLRHTAVWALSILDVGAADLARAFAKDKASRTAAVCTLSAAPGPRTGALVLDAPAWLECGLREEFAVGDHTLVIGDVLAVGTQDRRPPLVFLHGAFQAVEKARPIRPAGLGYAGARRHDCEV